MQTTLPAYQNKKLFAWLLYAWFFISSIVFTGYTEKSIVHHQQVVQTAWQYNFEYKIAIRNISYKKATIDLYEVNRNNNSGHAIAIFTFNKLIQVKLIHVCNKFIVAKPLQIFIQKKIPQSSEELPRISIAA